MKTTRARLRLLLLCLTALALFTLAGCGAGNFGTVPAAAAAVSASTPALTGISVAIDTLPSEDLVGPCHFDLLLQQPTATQAGVLVVYERGDSAAVFEDAQVRAAMANLNIAMLWAHQCVAASNGDLQANAAAGPARVLTAALAQLATQTAHPELAQTPIVPFGFSAAGVLSLTLAKQLPQRVATVIAYAAGAQYTNLDGLEVTPAMGAVPSLILVNTEDLLSGDLRSLRLFDRGRALGAPWGFATQNGTGHCCTLSTRSIMLPWIAGVFGSAQKASLSPGWGALATFTCNPASTVDEQGEHDCAVAAPLLAPFTPNPADPAGTTWTPDQATADAWLAWVTNPVTNN